jgi:exosortase/archaeosortase family protein
LGEKLVKNIHTENKNNEILPERLELQWSGINYAFSKQSLIFFSFGIPIFSCLIYLFLNLSFNRWVTEMFIKQISFLLDIIFNIEASVVINPEIIAIYLPNPSQSGRVLTSCYGAEVISIFIGIILATSSSQDRKPEMNLIWRKTKIIIITILSTYILFLFRIVLMLAFVHNGMPMHIIHDSSYYLISLISFILIIYVLRTILPEFIISLHYIHYTISNKEFNNPVTEKIKTKEKNNLIKELTVERKELYYPLIGITVYSSILYVVVLFLNVYGYGNFDITVNPYEMILPLLLALIFLISLYLLDVVKALTKLDLILPILTLMLIVCLFFFISILVYFLVGDILNSITVVIYFTSVIFIYYFFHKEVKNYLLIKRV